MQKTVFIMACFLTMFILSCGNSETEQSCVTAFDCPDGKICSGGMCVDGNPSGGITENDADSTSVDDNDSVSGELPDGGNNVQEDKTDSDNAATPDSANDNDTETPETPDTANDSDTETPDTETPDTVNDNDTTTPETPDTANDSDAETPDTETPDTVNDNDTTTPETPDTASDSDAETPDTETPDTQNDNDTESVDDADVESYYNDWDSSPDDEVCEFVMQECLNPITDFGCLPAMEKEFPNYCNGLDDDCDGKVDEGCFCDVGQTQPCFRGEPNKRNVGSCQDGIQTCNVGSDSKTGTWGDCIGGISPKEDICDNADNDCNGCVDDGNCCNPPVNCGYEIGDAQPFTDKIIDGNQIYDTSHLFNDAATATWEWTLTKGPCDVVLGKTSFSLTSAVDGVTGTMTNAADSVTFSGVGLSKFKVNFQLSGSYTLHLKITRTNGEVYECEWVIRVVSNGLRIELCWDTTGAHLSGGRDLDLFLGKNGVTEDVEVEGACGFSSDTYPGWTEDTACFFGNCQTAGYNNSSYAHPWDVEDWGYAETNSTTPNPRLDIDNIHDVGKPENINLDNPKNGDTFRVLVRLYPWSIEDDSSEQYGGNVNTHPVVNVYCGGTLKATYGVSPQYTLKNEDDSWKVVQIKWVGGVSSDACELAPNLDIVNGVPYYENW